MKKCNKCGFNKEKIEFYKNISLKDGLSNWCKECISSREKGELEKCRLWYDEWKSSQGCSKCKENRPYVLDLHHINSSREGDKYRLLSRIISSGTYSFEKRKNKILKEAEGCIVLCSNCHREFHFLERKDKIDIENYLK
jgi:hypothetical protein